MQAAMVANNNRAESINLKPCQIPSALMNTRWDYLTTSLTMTLEILLLEDIVIT